jgi:hypothetical protein
MIWNDCLDIITDNLEILNFYLVFLIFYFSNIQNGIILRTT